MKKILTYSIAFVFLLIPFAPSLASGGDFTFRSTVLGDNVRNTHGFVYEIVNQKDNFNSSEDVYALTRIFNIRNVNSFQFKQVVYSSNNNAYQTLYSPVYRPYGHWWAETYSWVNFGKLANGNYNLKTYISVDGEYYRELSTKNFTVGNSYNNYNNPCSYNDYNCLNNYNDYNHPCAYNDYNCQNNYNNFHNYNNYNYNYRPSPSFSFSWLKTGLGVNSSYNTAKTVRNEKSDFRTSENIYTLLRLTNIRDVYNFQIKQEVYNSSNRIVRTSESSVYSPNNSYWSESFVNNKIGTLRQGDYKIKSYIKTNNGSYKYIAQKNITVNNYNYNHNYNQSYNYNYTHSDNYLRHNSGYIYSLDNPKTTFQTNENVVVLTKLSNIRNINTFQIKHELYLNGNSRNKVMESPAQSPRNNYWEYNYNSNNFGNLPAGNHKIKVYIRINNGPWKLLDTVSITVNNYGSYNSNNYNKNYNYDWTETGDQVSATTNPANYYAYNNQY